jgi:hypothetical protein
MILVLSPVSNGAALVLNKRQEQNSVVTWKQVLTSCFESKMRRRR